MACQVAAVTNALGTNGAEPCGTGITTIADGASCTVTCAAGFHPSTATAACTTGTLATFTCDADLPCNVVAVANAEGANGAEPCGSGVTAINSGDDCTVDCAIGFHPSATTAACTNGVLATVTCDPACTVTAVTNGAGAQGVSPCGPGITEIAEGGTCTMECEAGFHPSAPTATCTSGQLDAVTCDPDVACQVGVVTNGLADAAGAAGGAPCGAGITSINSGDDCTVACADGYRAVPATATCSNGVLADRECRLEAPCTVAAITNGAGVNGAEPCGSGITSILNGEQCTVECATGFNPSAATATCNAGTLDPVTCVEASAPCQVGTVANGLADAAGVVGAAPCGAGVTSINSGDNCNVQCADGYYPTSATSACTNGAFAPLRECTATPPSCTVAAVANAAGVSGAEPCGVGITSIANAGQCTVTCAAGYHPSATTATCTAGVLDPISCDADVVTTTAAPDDSSSGLLIGLALLALGVAAVIAIVVCLNQKPKATKPKASKRAVKPVAAKPTQEPPAPPPAPPAAPTPTQSQPVAVMRPMTTMVQSQPQVQTIAAPAQARAVVAAPAQASAVVQAAPLAQAVQVAPTLAPSSSVVLQNAASPRMFSVTP